MKLKCLLFGHKVGKKTLIKRVPYLQSIWKIKCSDCGYTVEYSSPRCRLIGTELFYGFKKNK
jgi:hypothetical protein